MTEQSIIEYCRSNNCKWEDKEFPADDTSLYKKPPGKTPIKNVHFITFMKRSTLQICCLDKTFWILRKSTTICWWCWVWWCNSRSIRRLLFPWCYFCNCYTKGFVDTIVCHFSSRIWLLPNQILQGRWMAGHYNWRQNSNVWKRANLWKMQRQEWTLGSFSWKSLRQITQMLWGS